METEIKALVAILFLILLFIFVYSYLNGRSARANSHAGSAKEIDIEKGNLWVKTVGLKNSESSDTLSSIDRVAQDISNLPKAPETPKSGKKKGFLISKTGALQISSGPNSPSLERKNSPLATEESRLSQIKVRVRSATVKGMDGEAPRFSKTTPTLIGKKTESSGSHSADNSQSELNISEPFKISGDGSGFNPDTLAALLEKNAPTLIGKKAESSGSNSIDNLQSKLNISEPFKLSGDGSGFNPDALAALIQSLSVSKAASTLSNLKQDHTLLILQSLKLEKAIEILLELKKEDLQNEFYKALSKEDALVFNMSAIIKDVEISTPELIAQQISKMSPEKAAQVILTISSDDKRSEVVRQIENPEYRFYVKKAMERS